MRHNKGHNAGFTVIEMVAVLIIVAILSAVAISRVAPDASNLRAEVNDLKAGLRYAQQMAIASDSTITFGITVTSNNYTLVRTGGAGNQPNLPGESSPTHTFNGITATAGTFTFNEWGGLAAGSATATTLTRTGGGSRTINVISETGYAYES